MKNKILILVMIFILSGCSDDAPKDKASYQIVPLFEQDGCKVYRFIDDGSRVYFANCSNSASAYWAEQSGKIKHYYSSQTLNN